MNKFKSMDFDGLGFPIEFGYETTENGYVIYSPLGTKLPPYKVTEILNNTLKKELEHVTMLLELEKEVHSE